MYHPACHRDKDLDILYSPLFSSSVLYENLLRCLQIVAVVRVANRQKPNVESTLALG